MKVLLATDGSPHSEEAAWFLSRLPHREPLELSIVTVVSPPITAFYSPTREFIQQIAKDDREFAESQQIAARQCFEGANAEITCHILEGRPHEQIAALADELKVDLIVLGAKGHSKIDRILLGSTSDYVATHAHCSVLIIRPTQLRQQPSRPISVAIAYDASDAARAALDELLVFDWKTNTKFTLCTVAGYDPVFNPDFGYSPESLLQQAEESLGAAKTQLASRVESVEDRIIEHTHVSEGLVQFTEQQHSDLIVVGESGRSSIARALLGSVSRYILRHANCGVWIARNRSDQGAVARGSQATKRIVD